MNVRNKQDCRACAFRTREWAGGWALEIGGLYANALTSVEKDSMVIFRRPARPSKTAKILGYTRDKSGIVVRHHIRDIANTLCPGNLGTERNTSQYVLEAKRRMDNEYEHAVRKLTPRECFRLMDVDEESIDKIQGATVVAKNGKKKPAIPKSQQYKLAGNSIVVSCLYHIFRQLFIGKR